MLPSPDLTSSGYPPPFSFPRTSLLRTAPVVVTGRSTLIRPSPVCASRSAVKSCGSRSVMLPSPVRTYHPEFIFEPGFTSTSIRPSPVCACSMSKRPSMFMLPSCVSAFSDPSRPRASIRPSPLKIWCVPFTSSTLMLPSFVFRSRSLCCGTLTVTRIERLPNPHLTPDDTRTVISTRLPLWFSSTCTSPGLMRYPTVVTDACTCGWFDPLTRTLPSSQRTTTCARPLTLYVLFQSSALAPTTITTNPTHSHRLFLTNHLLPIITCSTTSRFRRKPPDPYNVEFRLFTRSPPS